MAFWLVYQGNSWKRARKGGYLWAPKVGKPKAGKKGHTKFYWANMERVQPGDLIFSGVNNAVRAVSQAALPAYTADRPNPLDDAFWYGDGWRLDVAYTDLPQPLFYAEWVPAVLAQMPALHSPFTRKGKPNQGYLFALPDSAGEYLLEQAAVMGVDLAAAVNADAPPPAGGETERQALGRARIGQGKFRDDLLRRWNGRCPASGLDRPELLRASHIKPWASSNNVERLDPANGLLLSAAYDAAFDACLVSFNDDGRIHLASDFPTAAAIAAGIDPAARLSALDAANRRFLAAHRDLVAARVLRASKSSEAK